jgi:flagellar hook-length control protein FliK
MLAALLAGMPSASPIDLPCSPAKSMNLADSDAIDKTAAENELRAFLPILSIDTETLEAMASTNSPPQDIVSADGTAIIPQTAGQPLEATEGLDAARSDDNALLADPYWSAEQTLGQAKLLPVRRLLHSTASAGERTPTALLERDGRGHALQPEGPGQHSSTMPDHAMSGSTIVQLASPLSDANSDAMPLANALAGSSVAANVRKQQRTGDGQPDTPSAAVHAIVLHEVGATRHWTMAGPPDRLAANVVQQLGEALRIHAETILGDGQTEFRLQVEPPELGTLQIHLVGTDTRLSARVVASEEMTQRFLEQHADALRERLESSGLVLDRLDIGWEGGGNKDQEFDPHEPVDIRRERPSTPGSRTRTRPTHLDILA